MTPPISAEELLAQLDEEVALLVASTEEQESWARRTGFPTEEIALQLYDSVPGWLDRLRQNRLIDSADERSIAELIDYMKATQTQLFKDGPFVTSAPEWQKVRELASIALQALRRPLSEKA